MSAQGLTSFLSAAGEVLSYAEYRELLRKYDRVKDNLTFMEDTEARDCIDIVFVRVMNAVQGSDD